jgi:hypothetical protein
LVKYRTIVRLVIVWIVTSLSLVGVSDVAEELIISLGLKIKAVVSELPTATRISSPISKLRDQLQIGKFKFL